MTWTVAEQYTAPKQQPGTGEDRLVLAPHGTAIHLAAVVDGATDKSGRSYGRQTGGALAANTVADTLLKLSDRPPEDAVGEITAALAALREAWDIATDDLLAPSAVCAVAALEQDLVWRVGDVHIAVLRDGTWEQHPADKAIDRVVAAARAALLHIEAARGRTWEDLSATDPGREMVMPILRAQNVLANTADTTPLGFGVLDGRGEVPARYVETVSLEGVTEVVLASDGYLSPAPSLAAAEEELSRSLAEDPLRIGAHPATKGVLPGASAFDDRSYLRLVRV